MPKTTPALLYADTSSSADALYLGRVEIHDPFISMMIGRRKIAVVNALECGRVKKDSAFDKVLALEPYMRKAREIWPRREVGPAEVIFLIAREHSIQCFRVPSTFPARVYETLFELGLDIEVSEGSVFPEREVKREEEALAIREGNRCSAAGIGRAEAVLRESRIKAGKLVYRGAALTSERLQTEIEIACLQAGGVSLSTIAAGGAQGCDPHQRGSGPLRANELIVVDVFPRVTKTGYFGDMTRTFLKGRASDAQRALVATVRKAQKSAIGKIRAGVDGRKVHAAIVDIFTQAGYETKETASGWVGFFHGTGHGLGLAVHEAPRVNASYAPKLKRGTVVTVEPGLYYPAIGGCRIEDVVQVTQGPARMLSSFHYRWEIR